MGGRRLKWWLRSPLTDPACIRERLDAVRELKENNILRQDLRRHLSQVYDLERLAGKIGLEVATARDLIALKTPFFAARHQKLLEPMAALLLSAIRQGIDEMGDLYEKIHRALVDNPPQASGKGA